MTITEARLWVRGAVRDAGGDSTVYLDIDVDRAILEAGDHFLRETRYVKKTDNVAITAGSTAFPTTIPIASGFLPERVIDVWITGEETPLQLVDYPVVARQAARDTSADVPTLLAFLSTTGDGLLWPEPDAAYTAKLRYWQPFGVTVATVFSEGWTAGTTTAGTLAGTLNIPDSIIRPVLTLGAAGILKTPSKENGYGETTRKEFEAYCTRMKGAGNLGSRVIYMQPAPSFVSTPDRPVDRPAADG